MDANEVAAALAEPFDSKFIKWKPQAVSGNRCLAVAYLDVRAILKRLDGVLGINGWQDDYEFRDCGSVVCRLQVHVGGVWVTKVDVGSPSEQPDAGDRLKAAVSDALKRAATKVGVGRYLYYLPHSWVDYDAQKRQIVKPPALPAWALPKPRPANNTTAGAEPRAREAPAA